MLKIDIHKTFKGKNESVDIACSAKFEAGEVTALFGKSGAGKTTLLRIIAGLDTPNKGSIIFNDITWFSESENLSLMKRPVSMVFQDFNLFRNMTVLKNLVYAAEGALSDNVQGLCNDLGITELFERYPHELSKGQQQKVAIVRSLCVDTEVLLLDEPFSALDDEIIMELVQVIEKLRKDLNLTVILVTHRKDIILHMAQSVVLLDENYDKQGIPAELIKTTFKST